MKAPDLSVVIPCFNRTAPLKVTLASVAAAQAAFEGTVEVILVDDGSDPPLPDQLQGFSPGVALTHLRQSNQGSIVARNSGLAAATGDHVLFLDSDDLVHPQKFAEQVGAMRRVEADVSYADMARAVVGPAGDIEGYEAAERLPATSDPATLYIEIQPAPHNAIYGRSYLMRGLAPPLFGSTRAMDPSGDAWMYYNLSIIPAKIIKLDGPYCAAGPHEEDRFSRHWENLGVASLRLMEAFQNACPATQETLAARTAVGAAAFRSWRGLPRDFDAEFIERMLGVYKKSPGGPLENLGPANFTRLAGLIGPLSAGRILRLLRSRRYSETRTLSNEQYEALLRGFRRGG